MSRLVLAFSLICCVIALDYPVQHRQAADSRPYPQLTQAQAAVDATAAWNSVCAQWEFPAAPMGARDTFASAWAASPLHVLSFEQALAGISYDVNAILWGGGGTLPGGDDSFNFTIQNWE